MKWFLFLAILYYLVGAGKSQDQYNFTSIESPEDSFCPSSQGQKLREEIRENVLQFLNDSVLPVLRGHGACGCGGLGWRRAAYLNMSDPTQTCPPAWELITTPRRSCARPSSARDRVCYSAMFPQGNQYSQICGIIVGYQIGQPQAFVASQPPSQVTIDNQYVDGVSLTYGNPRQHIWTFANALDENPIQDIFKCPCATVTPIHIPPFVGNDYFCETGVPPGQRWSYTFYADDPLWDGHGCGPTSACECTFNNPPWFCKQLPQSTNADLEIRLCSAHRAAIENTPIELIEIYTK